MAKKNDDKLNVNDNSGIMAGIVHGGINVTLPSLAIKHSILADILHELISSDYDFANDSRAEISYDVEDKLNHNNIIKYREIINEYYNYSLFCETTINSLDDMKAGTKNKILKYVHDKYKLAKGEYFLLHKDSGLSEIEIIRKNADNVIDKVKTELGLISLKSEKIQQYNVEDYERNLLAFIVFCFVECKILEKPVGKK